MTAIASPHTPLRLAPPEWFEGGILIALIGVAVIALSIPVVLVVISIVDVVSWVIGRIS